LTTSGLAEPLFDPPIPVVIPPRPRHPDVVARRQQQAMASGRLKAGNTWSTRLNAQLRERLQLDTDYALLLTTSGTAALELAVVAAAGPAEPGAVAVVPSFTFRATVDVLLRLGYQIRYVDVNAFSWTLDATALDAALHDDRVRLVVCVDTFGNPCAYEALGPLCAARGVPLVADSAASFGSRYRGRPVGQQAAAHAFSMSFAKVLTAAGAGGAVTFHRDAVKADLSVWTGSQLMGELHAIAALDQLPALDQMVAIRGEVAAAYASVLQGVSGIGTQQVAQGDVHSYVHWVARVPGREALAERLAELGVATKPYFPAQHRHHPVAVSSDRLPVCEQLDAHALAFPTSSELSGPQIQRLQRALEIALDDIAAGSAAGQEAKDA
jgi:dTDP-4-amino-4,6-dideoxygalactose transaminase